MKLSYIITPKNRSYKGLEYGFSHSSVEIKENQDLMEMIIEKEKISEINTIAELARQAYLKFFIRGEEGKEYKVTYKIKDIENTVIVKSEEDLLPIILEDYTKIKEKLFWKEVEEERKECPSYSSYFVQPKELFNWGNLNIELRVGG